MAAFTALVAINLIRGRHPACACFGALSAEAPIGVSTLARNAMLLAGSVAVLIAGLLPGACSAGCYNIAGARDVAIAGGALVLAAIAAGAIVIQSLTATVGALAGRVRELEAALGGAPASRRQTVDMASLRTAVTTSPVTRPDGGAVQLAGVLDGAESTLLLLMSAHCSACQRLRERLRDAPPPADLQVVAIIDRPDADHAPLVGDPLRMFVDGGRIAAAAGVQAFPSAVLLDADLEPVGDLLTGTTQIRRYLDDRAAFRPAITEGDPLHV